MKKFLAIFLLLALTRLWAHTLPISYVTVVSDAEYLHLEWMLNPFELTIFPDLDDNHDSRLSEQELRDHGEVAKGALLEALQISVDGKQLQPETAGLIRDMDGHHLTLRGHFKIAEKESAIELALKPSAFMSGAHVAQVRFGTGGSFQNAQLDSQNNTVQIRGGIAKVPVPAVSLPRHAPEVKAIFFLWCFAATGFFLFLFYKLRRSFIQNPANSAQ